MDFASAEFQTFIANIILLVITGAGAAIAKAVYTFIKTNTSAKQFSILEQVASSAVDTAEQGELAGFVSDKKATALGIVAEALKNAGIRNLSAEQIDAAIEAAVMQNFNSGTVTATVTSAEGAVATATAEPTPPEVDSP